MSRFHYRSLIGLAMACVVAGLALGIGVVFSGTDRDGATAGAPHVTTPSSGGDAAGRRDSQGDGNAQKKSRPPGRPATATHPAAIIASGPGPFFSSDDIDISNGWQISDHIRFTAVDAGADPYHRSTGVLGIFRQNYVHVTQDFDVVRVPGAGSLKITGAPLGRGKVQTWAQRHGDLQFVGSRGITGTLHLKDDTVTLNTQ